ncbi:MAG: lytic transglycosylase domain-containing protein [Burkholderiaceae bacterium]
MRSRSTSERSASPAGTAWLAQLARLAAGVAVFSGIASAAHADVWARIDERGVAHFAPQRLDDRYELFLRGADRFGVLPLPEVPNATPAPRASDAPTAEANTSQAATVDTSAAGDGASPTRLLRWLEASPAVQRPEPLLREVAEQHRLDAQLLKAVIAAESGFDAQAVSPKGAVGLMQVMPATAQRYGVHALGRTPVAQRLTDPRLNLNTGSRYLRDLMQRFEGRLDLVLAAYNAGEGAVERHGLRIPPYAETQNYVRTVMQIYRALRPQIPWAAASASAAARADAAAVVPNASSPAASSSSPQPDAPVPGGAVGRRNMIAPLTAVR